MTAPSRAPLLLHHPVVIPPGAAVLEIAGVVRSSAVDGPGNRYVLFLQGCNFDCTACHNPTTIGRCDACGCEERQTYRQGDSFDAPQTRTGRR